MCVGGCVFSMCCSLRFASRTRSSSSGESGWAPTPLAPPTREVCLPPREGTVLVLGVVRESSTVESSPTLGQFSLPAASRRSLACLLASLAVELSSADCQPATPTGGSHEVFRVIGS